MKTIAPAAVGSIGTRIRAYLGDTVVADSRDALLLRESPYKLYYCFPQSDVAPEVIDRGTAKSSSRRLGTRESYTVLAGGRTAEDAAFAFVEPTDEARQLAGHIGFEFEKLDRWFEEEEELIGHPRDPFTRIDVRRGMHHVRVEVAGVTVIETRRPFLLQETGLEVRYYVPNEDVLWEHFRESETRSICPYKGVARYWSVVANGEEKTDAVWAYRDPFNDAVPVREAVGLYHEKLDVLVDGQKIERGRRFFTK